MNPNSLSNILKKGSGILANAGIEEAGLDAWLLLEYETGYNRGYYLAHPEEEITSEQVESYFQMIEQRGRHVPLQHLTNQAWFMGYEFYVNEHVLVPRQDTECLVLRALDLLKKMDAPQVLDMCTGSGCIILSILAECSSATGVGCDLSEKALEVARLNAKALEVDDRITFYQGDLFRADCFLKNNSRSTVLYDMIISNPPYIATAKIADLSEEVKDHDPWMALDGKEDGLYFYRKITNDAKNYLRSGGFLLYEIGYDQGEAVTQIMKSEGFSDVQIEKDLAGLDRLVYGRL